MKIILLKDVPKVGQRYDIKDVSDGFALNMLLPKGLAQRATPDAIKKIEAQRANDLTQRKIEENLLVKNLELLKNTTVTIREKANEKGHLFAGITKESLVSEIEKVSRIKISPEFIVLDKPIKEVGTHKVEIMIGDKRGEFVVNIESL